MLTRDSRYRSSSHTTKTCTPTVMYGESTIPSVPPRWNITPVRTNRSKPFAPPSWVRSHQEQGTESNCALKRVEREHLTLTEQPYHILEGIQQGGPRMDIFDAHLRTLERSRWSPPVVCTPVLEVSRPVKLNSTTDRLGLGTMASCLAGHARTRENGVSFLMNGESTSS